MMVESVGGRHETRRKKGSRRGVGGGLIVTSVVGFADKFEWVDGVELSMQKVARCMDIATRQHFEILGGR
jgi:hypothetical protein